MSYSRASEYSEVEQLIAFSAKAIVHPARLRILYQLEHQNLSLRQLSEDQPLPRQTVMNHLNVLISHGLVFVESPQIPATYSTRPNQWGAFISHAVRLTHRFKHANAA